MRCLGMDIPGQDFAGTCAVVTGGSSGIGRACVLELARRGAAVAFTCFGGAETADEIVREVEQRGGRALARETDVTDEAAVEALFAEAEAAFGPVRLLVNSAGINFSGTRAKEMTLGEFDQIMRVNLYGPFLTCRRFVRGLDGKNGGGRVVNISSIHEDAPRVGAAAYVSAKGGLAQLTATLALELAPSGIAVNSVAPGMILTPMNQSAMEDPRELERKEQAIPWGRAGTPEEVAEVVCFLLSPRAEYITGTTVTIDGGLSLRRGEGA
jgi:glucose 1-dehydrogenase